MNYSLPVRRSRLTILLLCLTVLTGATRAHDIANSQAWQGPVTVHTRFKLPDQQGGDGFNGVWLAGIATTEGEPPTALSLSLSQTAGWFPVWSLRLQSDQGLLPRGVQAENGSGLLSGSQTYTLPNIGAPRWGHVYESMFSYDPETGTLSLWVHDATLDETLFSGEFVGDKLAESFYPAAGYLVEKQFVALDDVAVHPHYVPRGVVWNVVELVDGQPKNVQLTRVDRLTTNEVGVHLALVESPGVFRLSVQRDGGVHEIARLENASGSQVIAVPLDLLPPGTTKLVLEYSDASGQLWFTEERNLSVGRLMARFDPTTFDQDKGQAVGGVTLVSDGPLDVPIRIGARLWKQVWDDAARGYNEELWDDVTLFDGTMHLSSDPVERTLLIDDPAPEAGLWRVEFTVELASDVPVTVTGMDRLFATYRPARSTDDGPFTLVVLPDTQYQTHASPQGGHPDIFKRMIHWITERAEADNIGLVLHVGDITDHNQPRQWEVAQNSMFLLDGIVPYALAIGNHDIGSGGNAGNRGTLFNDYFPLARYQERSTFGGVFEPGRLENSYQLYRLGGDEYMVLSLEFLPRDQVLDWANEVVAAHPEHRVIVITHTYTSVSGPQRSIYGDRYGIVHDPEGSVNTGIDIWNKFARKHPNVMMVFSGHVTPDAVVPRQVQIGDDGNKVYEMLVNFQHRPEGGAGWLALLHFTPEHDIVAVELYSPYIGAHRIETGDFFGVPFCIDLEAERFVGMHEPCDALPVREATVGAW